MNAKLIDQLERDVARAMLADRHRIRQRLRSIKRSLQQGKPVDKVLGKLRHTLDSSVALRRARQDRVPKPTFAADLPINSKRDEIAAAIRVSSVVVVCGETGSGKSTQLPKICLDVGRGIDGFIGHTQPRRIAARSVAARLADELGSPIGRHVGFKIRFTDTVREASYIKLMTDGILLAETQHDRFLERYDTIIIDEAHERSLNIDFLLGYLNRLLRRRPDLRLIITSATIDALRFADHFGVSGTPAPIIEVSGRTYPVETRYAPIETQADGREADPSEALISAVAELCAEGAGDILIFLPTEREIRDAAKVLRGWSLHQERRPEILPLYARLPANEQQRIFATGKQRRIVLATNVAESSLTVPGIRYVIDTGTARISRYAARSKVQRLPIEPISQASADQRQGRCGRLGPGICIRLYSEADYRGRDRYTTPEIRRTNLAGVILQMLAFQLGDVEAFPFLDPPRSDAIRDGYKTLFELGAIDTHRQLTEIGRRMSRVPVDPRIARMILAGQTGHCLAEILIIAAAIEIQDPRERPPEKEKLADECHAKFLHQRSDFIAYLKLWDFFQQLKTDLTRSKFRKACRQNFLSFNRLREWQDIHRQLKRLVAEGRLDDAQPRDRAAQSQGRSQAPSQDKRRPVQVPAPARSVRTRSNRRRQTPSRKQPPIGPDLLQRTTSDAKATEYDEQYAAVHQALLTSFLSNIAMRSDRREYQVAGAAKAHLWPGSGIAASPKWVVAAEAIETYKRYLRTAAAIDPQWIEPLAEHLVKRSYSDPHWSRKQNTVLATERVTLFGLPIVVGRRVPYGKTDPDGARQLFIQHALVEGELRSNAEFVEHNRGLLDELQSLGAKARQSDYLVADGVQYEFYDARLPEHVYDAATLNHWLRKAEPTLAASLKMKFADLVPGTDEASADAFPDRIQTGQLALQLDYRFQPGAEDDGLSVSIPRPAFRQVESERLDWLVPGMLEEKLVALIRCLPKSIRRNLAPAAESARQAVALLEFGNGPFLTEVAAAFSDIAEEPIPVDAFQLDRLPPHLRVNIRVLDDQGQLLGQGRDLGQLRAKLDVDELATGGLISDRNWQRDGITTWDFDELPERVEVPHGGTTLVAYPALVDRADSVALTLLDTEQAAQQTNRGGLRRLFVLAEQRELKPQVQWLPQLNQCELWSATLRYKRDLRSQLTELLADLAYVQDRPTPRTAAAFAEACRAGRQQLLFSVQDVAKLVGPLFHAYHQARLALDERTAANWQDAVDDMRRQVDALMAEGFLVAAPWRWLSHYPRYLKAIPHRLEKLKTAGVRRDREALSQLAPHWEQYQQRRSAHIERGIVDPELSEYRWMLEEFRVSLFAQTLGTAVKVSPQRLERQWGKCQRADS